MLLSISLLPLYYAAEQRNVKVKEPLNKNGLPP